MKINFVPAFSAKYTEDGKRLLKRKHGSHLTISANSTDNIIYTVTYSQSKFAGLEIMGCNLGDIVSVKVLDDSNGTYSGTPNSILNQFAFDVEMSPTGICKDKCSYSADLYYGMVIRVEYTNNESIDKYIGVNFDLHEVKEWKN